MAACRNFLISPERKAMIAVIFEVCPRAEAKEDYLAIAAGLAPLLATMDGFLSIERFQSLSQPEKILSLSFWRDEEAVKRWRNTEEHRHAQAAGRAGIFAGYRLRIAAVVRDYGLLEREQAPADSRSAHG
jgi:heme-degrading monooxygenase HmoA